MRSVLFAATMMLSAFSASQAAEITVVTPGFVAFAGLRDLAASYGKETGNTVTVKMTAMGAMMDTAKNGGDVAILPQELMSQLAGEGGVVPGTRKPLGRVEIGLIVPAGAKHPDISTVPKLIAALKSANRIAYSSPFTEEKSAQAMIIHNILHRPDFAGVNGQPPAKGNAVVGIKEGAQMGLQLVCQVPDPAVSLVGPLPPELNAHLDGEIAVSAKSGDPKAAGEFVAYLLSPAAADVWKANGLDRH